MTQPIAYADKTGFVLPVPIGGRLNPEAVKNLTPLYTPEDVNNFQEYFEKVQDHQASLNIAPTLQESADIATDKANARQEQSKAASGTSIAEAAKAAVGVK